MRGSILTLARDPGLCEAIRGPMQFRAREEFEHELAQRNEEAFAIGSIADKLVDEHSSGIEDWRSDMQQRWNSLGSDLWNEVRQLVQVRRVAAPEALLLTPEQLAAWGWRIPFVMSAALVAVGLWVRLKVTETPEFQALLAKGPPPVAPVKGTVAACVAPTA